MSDTPNHEPAAAESCFVIMPFGTKPMEGEGRAYDFDKVYRVIIQRAVRRAGLQPVRADERTGSHIIHGEMFAELRDRKVVLADLSLHNPNVYYELGIRHVMAPRSTVLICQAGTSLPFDIRLSRVIFYNFDGVNLDYEEAERVTEELLATLQEAKNGTMPDSPVHALLQQIVQEEPRAAASPGQAGGDDQAQLERYHQGMADTWRREGRGVDELIREETESIFGLRSLGLWCLQTEPLPAEAPKIAELCCNLGQFDLAVKLFEAAERLRPLEYVELLRFGSALSELTSNLASTQLGLAKMQQALAKVLGAAQSPDDATIDPCQAARCHQNLGALQLFKHHLGRLPEDLHLAIQHFEAAVRYGESEAARQRDYSIYFVARVRLRLLVLLRMRDRNLARPDAEGHREMLLSLRGRKGQDARSQSYLRWYQAIGLADAGDANGSKQLALKALAEDSLLRNTPNHGDIGRKQYTSLRRLLERYGRYLRHPGIVGFVSQILQSGLTTG